MRLLARRRMSERSLQNSWLGFILVLMVGVVCEGWTSDAFGQQNAPWVADRRYGEGPGFSTNGIELHPGVAAEFGYDSNFFRASGDEPEWGVQEAVVPALRLQLTPALRMMNQGALRRANGLGGPPPKVIMEGRVAGQLNRLVAVDDAYKDAVAARTLVGGEAALSLDILPERPWGANIGLTVSRIAQPNNLPQYSPLNRNFADGAFMVHFRPGGGVLDWGLGYAARLTVFDDPVYGLNEARQTLSMRGRYRFLPRTSLVYDGDATFYSYLQPGTRQVNSRPLSSQLGVNGLVTTRLGVLIMAGWKGTFFDQAQSLAIEDYDGLIGRGEVTWYLGGAPDKNEGGRNVVGLSTIRLGVQRDVQTSGLANYYKLNRAYGEVAYFFAGVASLTLNGGVSLIEHPTPRSREGRALTADGQGLNEVRPDARLLAEYRVLQTLALTGSVEYSASVTNNRITLRVQPPVRDNLRFSRVAAMVGVRWFN